MKKQSLTKPDAIIAIVSNDSKFAASVKSDLGAWGFSSIVAHDDAQLTDVMNQQAPTCVVLDVSQPDGLSDSAADRVVDMRLLDRLRSGWKTTPVVAVSSDPSISLAVSLVKHGAFDVVAKSCATKQISRLVDGLAKQQQADHRAMKHHEAHCKSRGMGNYEILGKSQAVMDVLDLVEQVAQSDATVLILGESGTGKELLARAIHHNSLRADKTFVPVNVAALPPNIAESILFGYEKGAYTGADTASKGWCETANGGTLLLDEIGEMDIMLQAKLLRFLQDGTFMRVGANQQQKADVRVIAATNREPKEMVQSHLLREDLYYRLNVFPIRMPPLRERREDIPILANTFLERSAELHRRQVVGFSEGAMECLVQYDWPGNIRQLENLVTRMVLLTRDAFIGISHVPAEIKSTRAGTHVQPEPELSHMKNVERQAIVAALEKSDGNAVAAAKLLGLGQATIYRKIKRFQIELNQIKADSRIS
ncbi:sigma 54-interacting transcriptional regulator [Stieleria marina]